MAHQADVARQAIAPGIGPGSRAVRGTGQGASVAAGRKGFKAELDDLRERMRRLGLGYDEIAADPAVFKVDGLPGGPSVEVIAEDDGSAACHYAGRSTAEAAEVIAWLPVPGHPEIEAATADTVIATWDGIEVEWRYRRLDGQPADADQVTAALLAHLGILEAHP